jgi:DNA-binding NarL/FixJ family response regulator
MNNSNINIAIVDDDKLIVELLKGYFDLQSNICVKFTALSGYDCLCKLNSKDYNTVDVLLIDLRMDNMDGIELTKQVKSRNKFIHIIAVSSHYQDSTLGYMIKSGVSAFLPKGISPKELLFAIFEVNKNGYYFLSTQIEILRDQISSTINKPQLTENNLTDREMEIIKLICRQKTAKEIAEALFITQRTVEGHKNNLFAKTGTKNIAGLVLYAVQQEIINPNEIII